MRVEVLTIPDCPNGPVARQHLAQALAGRPDVMVEHRVITTSEEAVRFEMHGSPTILIDGRDPFAEPGTAASLACRLYLDTDGRARGAPSAGQLREAMADAERLGGLPRGGPQAPTRQRGSEEARKSGSESQRHVRKERGNLVPGEIDEACGQEIRAPRPRIHDDPCLALG